jgi:hypothetical protein
MLIDPETLAGVRKAYSITNSYYKELRSLFEMVDIRFRIPEYGVTLKAIPQNRLFSNASGYLLSDDNPYPYYLWLPSWLGRFYLDPSLIRADVRPEDTSIKDLRHLAFVWTWLGCGDAYVVDRDQPECWIGVTSLDSETPSKTVAEVALQIWNYFRLETTCTGEQHGWLTGRFHPNAIGSDLSGTWFLRRFPLANLSTYYQVEKWVICPLGRKFVTVSNQDTIASDGETPVHLLKPKGITPSWIRSHLKLDVPDSTPITWEQIGVGMGLLGKVFRMRCHCPDGAHSFVVKLSPPKGSTWDEQLPLMAPFARESQAYEWLRNKKEKLAPLHPECFWSAHYQNGTGALVLEDLYERGAILADVTHGMTEVSLRSALRALARLHAACATTDPNVDRLQPPHNWMYSARSEALSKILRLALEQTCRLVNKWCPDDFPLKQLRFLEDWSVPETLESSHRGCQLVSVGHGDAWSNNIMFVHRGPMASDMPEAILLDWQFVIWGNPLVDVAYLLFSSADAALRRRERGWDLLKHYHAELLQAASPTLCYPFESCIADYHQAMDHGALMALANFEACLGEAPEAHAPTVARRLVGVLHDLEKCRMDKGPF